GRDLQADAIRERREKSAAEAVLNDVRIAVKRHAVRDEVRRAGEIRADLLNADEADGCLAEWPEAALPIGGLAVPEVEAPALMVAAVGGEGLIDQQPTRREVGLRLPPRGGDHPRGAVRQVVRAAAAHEQSGVVSPAPGVGVDLRPPATQDTDAARIHAAAD